MIKLSSFQFKDGTNSVNRNFLARGSAFAVSLGMDARPRQQNPRLFKFAFKDGTNSVNRYAEFLPFGSFMYFNNIIADVMGNVKGDQPQRPTVRVM